MSRDYQQSKVYRWETQFAEGSPVDFLHAQALVDYIWNEERLSYPPRVSLIHHNTTKWAGRANRVSIELQKKVSTKTIIHEIAHSMSSTFHDPDDHEAVSGDHGPLFTGIYIKLLHKYMCIDLFKLIDTAGRAGVDFDINARPPFLDN